MILEIYYYQDDKAHQAGLYTTAKIQVADLAEALGIIQNWPWKISVWHLTKKES